MFSNRTKFSAAAITLLLGMTYGGVSVNAHQTSVGEGIMLEPVRCEIMTNSSHGAVALESVFYSDIAADGTYRVRIASSGPSGNSSIQQGGYFSADANEPVILGMVSLGNRGATYNVDLTVTANGHDYSCSERFGDV